MTGTTLHCSVPLFYALLLTAPSWAAAQSPAPRPLTPDDVLASVSQHHPRVLEAMARRDAAAGSMLSARGAFDPQLSGYGFTRTGSGYYEMRGGGAELRQPVPWWGAEFWVGYRAGHGEDDDWLSYDSGQTLDGGEVRVGARVPLWRDGRLDSRRAARQTAALEIDRARASETLTRLELSQQAMQAFWAWVASGVRFRIATDLHLLAEQRAAQVRDRVDAGLVPPIDGLEARRLELSRRADRVSARRGLEAASLDLGLYVRDGDGRPAPPDPAALPVTSTTPEALPSAESIDDDLIACHPALASARAGLEARRVSVDLARAQLAPRVDFSIQYSRDFGQGRAQLAGNVVDARLEVGLPLGFRGARGQLQTANATLDQERARLEFLEDQLTTALRDTWSAWNAAQERNELAEEVAAASAELAAAERARFDAGDSTLLVVNIREQTAMDDATKVVSAAMDLWSTRLRWDALTACRD